MANKTLLPLLAIAATLAAAGSAPVSGQHRELGMLSQLEPGRWELRLRDAPALERICVRDGRRLIQLRHPQQQCERFIVGDEASDVTIPYSCRGKGYGRTTSRRESARLVLIESQGIAVGLPFNFVAEGRWVANDCAG
jgi:hypothetical protein